MSEVGITDQSSFHDRLRQARNEQRRQIREALTQLSPGEARYAGIQQPETPGHPVAVVIPSLSNVKDNPKPRPAKKTNPEPAPVRRPAQRTPIIFPEPSNTKAAETARIIADRDKRRADKLKQQAAVEAERKREEREEAKLLKKGPILFDEVKGFQNVPPRVFMPVIGNPNANGATPVKIDHNSTILIQPGRDIQEAIVQYQKHLNLISE